MCRQILLFAKSLTCFKHTFHFNELPLENVDSYKYLGLIFSYNGSFEKAINYLIKKCSRGTYLLNTALSNVGAHSAGLATELFLQMEN